MWRSSAGVRSSGASFVNPDLAARGYRLTDDCLYYLGSFTKIFVTTLIMQQVERGLVMLSRPVADYIPAAVATYGSKWPNLEEC
jgi:CubicO group peptidase (beta-lactamase class C family)